jgi:hypothetical protein
MKEILLKTFVTLALLLSISEVASGGTVRISTLLNGAVSEAELGIVSQDTNLTNDTCIITVAPAATYSVESVTAIKITDGGNAQSRRNAPAINIPIDVSAGEAENTWTFPIPDDEYDVEVTVNFTFRTFGIMIKGILVNGANMSDVLGDSTVSYVSETNTLTLNNASIIPETEMPGVGYIGDDDLVIMLIGNDTIQGAGGYAGISLYSYSGNATPRIIFTTNEDAPGQLISTDNTRIIDDAANVEYQNGLAFSQIIGGQMIGCFETYNLWVNGIHVTDVNKGNILFDENKTVRFDETTNTLTLRKANFTTGEDVIPVESMLESLTVNILDANYIYSSGGSIFVSRDMPEMPTLTFISTSPDYSGKLEFTGDGLQTGFNEEIVFDNALVYNPEERLISVVPTGYGLSVNGTEVTNVNYGNVLNDGTVSYEHATGTLRLKQAILTDDIVLADYCTLTTLTVMLLDSTTTTSKFISNKADVNLVFTINPNNPGSITFIGKNSADDIQSGFLYGEVSLLNGLLQAAVNENQDWKISNFFPIAPIVNEDNTEEVITINAVEYSIDLENQAIDNVLYTLPSTEGDENTNQGYDYDTDNHPGIIVSSGMTDDEVSNAVSNTVVGTAEFAQAFHGITLETPAGIGTISFTVKLLSPNAKIRIKVGENGVPYSPEGLTTDDYTVVEIPYSFSEPTFIYIYLLDETPAGSRSEAPFRGKVLGTTVKVSGYSGSCQASVNNGRASVYSYSASNANYNAAAGTMSMNNIKVGAASTVMHSRSKQMRVEADSEITYPIASLGPNFFDDFTGDLQSLRYIDLSGTEIEDMTVNRQLGTFRNIGEHTVICLPENNDDGDEANTVIGSDCQRLMLDSQFDFRLPSIDFTASNVTLLNTFTANMTTTLFVPFTIPAAQAASIGSFFNFKETKSGTVVFNNAETGDIEANKPYLFVPVTSEFSVNDVEVTGTDSSTATNGNFIGTYQSIVWESDQTDYYVYEASASGNVDEGHFVQINAGTVLPPFRAYLHVNGPESLSVVIEAGESTGIQTVNSSYNGKATWFAIDGQQLQARPTHQGLYINNGKKVIVR